MENKLQIFNNPEFGNIRIVEIDGEPWFVGKDVADALGYSNSSKAVMMHVDDEDKRFEMIPVADSQNGNVVSTTKTALINLSGVYSLILSSKLPSAKKFKHWLTSEVLPSIQKHGAYMMPDTIDRMIASPEFGIKLLTELKSEQEKRKALEEKVKADAPAVFFAESITGADTNILVRDLAKLLAQNGAEIGGNRLFELLRQDGYLIKSGSDYNMPTQKAMELGLFFVKETPRISKDGAVIDCTTKITPKGQKYFINKYAPKQALAEKQ
jgi:prophage antirepressor-like protein